MQGAALGGDNEKREKGPIEYTGLDISTLQFLGERLSTLPEGFVAHPHITKLMAARANMFKDPDSRVDWAMAEQLAFGAMLCHHLTPAHIPNTPSASTVPHHHVNPQP
jgi:2-oxoglutarate dehydrogenase complex dehydrogenase (E1) component-like enzyme